MTYKKVLLLCPNTDFTAYAIVIFILLVLAIFELMVYNYTTTSFNASVYICDKQACCNPDISQRNFDCDSVGCQNVIPNWTPPVCDNTTPTRQGS